MLARQLHLLRPTSLLVGAGLVAYAGCSSTPATTLAVTHPTMIEVSPQDFLGEVPCASKGPGLKRYVATLFDTNPSSASGGAGTSGGSTGDPATDEAAGQPDADLGGAGSVGATPFQLPSSLPTPCAAAVGFGYVTAGRHYQVRIDGYDTDDLTARALGAREMVSGSPAVLRKPSWSAQCNRAIAVDLTVIRADHCLTFASKTPDATGSLSIALSPLMAGLRCGKAAGQVDHFSVSLDVADGGEPREQTVACEMDAQAIFDELEPQQLVSAHVTAFSADGSSAFAGASCTAHTLPAATVEAQCSALSQVGTLRVDLTAALQLVSLSCGGDVNLLQVDVPGEATPRSITPPGCLQPFDAGFSAGPAALTVTAWHVDSEDAAGDPAVRTELGSLTCHGEVVPGQLVTAQCERNTAK